jgi:hypothetical protein
LFIFYTLFRQCFRLPYQLYEVLVNGIKNSDIFGAEESAAGQKACPVEIKVLGAMRTLERGTLHADVADMTGASTELHRSCFIKFIKFVVDFYYQDWSLVEAPVISTTSACRRIDPPGRIPVHHDAPPYSIK